MVEGRDVIVLVSGHLTVAAKSIVDELQAEHPGLGLINVATLKPFDDDVLIQKLSEARVVVTIENHWLASGLARIVAAALMARQSRAQLITVGVGDTFTHGGTGAYLEDFYGVGERHIRGAIAAALGILVDARDGSSGGDTIGLTEGVAEGL